MMIQRAILLSLCFTAAPIQCASPFKGNYNLPVTDCVGAASHGNGNGPSIHSAANQQLSDKCGKDVGGHIERGNSGGHPGGQQSRVQNVDKVSIDCNELTKDMQTVDFELNNTPYTAYMKSYSYDTVLQRNVWMGSLDNSSGYVNIVWNDSCDRDVFMFEVTLPTTADGRNVIRSVPCSTDDGSTEDCAWLTHVNMDPIQELESSEPHRQLHELSAEEEAEAKGKDADIELLRLMLENDGDAADIFHAQGGRKLAIQDGNGRTTHQYIMPSGRRLDDGSTIRVLWLYTAAAAAAEGGEANLKSAVASALVVSNNSFLQSGINMVFEMAAVLPVVYTETTHPQALSDLVSGKIANVMTWRNDYAADVVQMIINASDYCGFGYVMTSASSSFASSAFSVIYWNCLSYYSSPHEIGHNFGMDHDTANISASTLAYAHGFKYCSSPNLRSIMAYQCPTGSSATRMPLYSSPSVYYSGGQPTGDSSTCDNARVMRENKYIVSNFRTSSTTTPTASPPAPAPVTYAPAPPSVKKGHGHM